MPTKLPRLNVTVTEHQHSLLAELGELQGRSSASYIREMLDASTPMLEAMLPIFRQAANVAAEQPFKLQQAIKEVLAEVDGQKAQLNLLSLLAGSQSTVANDTPSDADAAPSVAREDASARTKPSKRAR